MIAVYARQGVTADVLDKLAKDSPLGEVLAAGLRNEKSPRHVMKEAIEEAGRAAAHNLERFLTTLGTIATAAPLLGLFGTVVGMIEIFGSQAPGGTNPQQLAHGISIALYNTAFGIAISIPSLIFYRHFKNKVDGFVVQMEQAASKLIDIVHGEREGYQTPVAVARRRTRMNFQRGRYKEEPEINLVPLIDVMMVILIFLMITTTYSKYTELQINLPTADAEKQLERPGEVSVLVNAKGQYVINKAPVEFAQHRAARRRAAPRRRRPARADRHHQRRRHRHPPVGDPRDGSLARRRPVADHLHDAVREVVRHWSRRGAVAWLLWPASLLFGVVVLLRRLLYKIRILRIKPPRHSRHRRRQPHRRRQRQDAAGAADRGDPEGARLEARHRLARLRRLGATDPRAATIASDPAEVGDEPILLARRSGCPVWVAPDRVAACRALRDEASRSAT